MEGLIKEGTLGFILLKCNIISEDDIRAALDEQRNTGCRFGEALVKLEIVTQEDIDWALSNQLDIPYVRLKKEMLVAEAVKLVPAGLARQFNLIPLIRGGDELNVAMADPLNHAAIEGVELATGCTVRVSVALLREIREMQDIFYGPATEPVLFGFESKMFSPRLIEAINADITGGKFLEYLLAYFIQTKLTHLSLQPMGEFVTVIGRRGGGSREIGRLSITHFQEFMVRLRRMAGLSGVGEPSDRGSMTFTFKEKPYGFQVLLLRGMGGDFVTFRPSITTILPETLAELAPGLDVAAKLKELTSGGGLLLVVHRDAEKRCRLMDLMLSEVDTAGKSVMLLGEGLGRGAKRFPKIPCRDLSHGEAHLLVSAALEHDPDILVVEDATEGQAFIAAGKAAMRGKLVVAGLALKDVASTVRHLLYLWHKHYVIPTYIRGIVSCRRVSLLCHSCRTQHRLTPEDSTALGAPIPAGNYYRAVGCPECDGSGYRGSRYLLDVIPFDSGVRETFETATDGREVMSLLGRRGYRGSAEEGADLLSSGDISPEEYVTSILL